VSVDTVCRFCGSPFLKVIVTGYNSAIRPKPLTSPRSCSYSNTVPTTPGNVGWLADNGSDWNRGESNVDLSERSGQAGRGCGDGSKESHLCVSRDWNIIMITRCLVKVAVGRNCAAEEYALKECGW
jgi:hypothetical protein